MRKFVSALTLAVTLAMASAPMGADARDWTYDSGPDQTHFLPEAPPAKTHSLRWSTKISDLPSGIYPMSPLLTYRGKVIVNGAATNSVLGLDAKTGEVVWRFTPDPRRSGSFGGYPNANQPQIEQGIYYTTANNGFLYAINADTGKKVWSYQVTGTDYNKTIARVAVCAGRVFFDSLGGIPAKGQHNIYAVDAKTGRKLWSTYAGAKDWPGEGIWPDAPTNPSADDTASLARNTRRFEARPGLACFGDRVQVFGEDGILRLLDTANGTVKESYNIRHDPMDLGFQVDGAVGITDPRTGDLLRTALNNRLVRLVVNPRADQPTAMSNTCPGKLICENNQDEQMKVHSKWRHPYGDCSQRDDCGVVTVLREGIVPTYTSSRNDGVVGGSVFSAGFAIADWENGKRVVYAPNHDGKVYRFNWDDPIGDKDVYKEILLDPIPAELRDGTVSRRPGGQNLYTSNDGDHCQDPDNCRNGPWEHRASNVSSPLVAGGVVYVAASFAHKMYGFDWKSGAKVWEFEIKWDDKAQYPPFGDTKPKPFTDLDEVVSTTPAHDGRNFYFAANNGTVYAISTQETITKPRKNLAILGSGVVPFIPKWKEALGAFDYVWTPKGDWYNPGYTSATSTTGKQPLPALPGGTAPFGYKGVGAAASIPLWPWAAALCLLLALGYTSIRSRSEAVLLGGWNHVSAEQHPAIRWITARWKLSIAIGVVLAISFIATKLLIPSDEGPWTSTENRHLRNLPVAPAQPTR